MRTEALSLPIAFKRLKAVLLLAQRLGPADFAKSVLRRLNLLRFTLDPGLKRQMENREGLEIGGPSPAVFGRKGIVPLYGAVGSLDNVNFADRTVWNGAVAAGATFKFDDRSQLGRQFICEASDLNQIADETYDFLLASHVLEHCANPLKTVLEWRRVVKPGGLMVIVLPDKKATFDHARSITTMAHLLKDYRDDIGEDDLSALPEILSLHDIDLDMGVLDRQELEKRSRNNHVNRCFHHHVFNTQLAEDVLQWAGLTLLRSEIVSPFDLVLYAQKPLRDVSVA